MKQSQQNKILELLADGEFHCTSEMAAMFMVDYRRRLVDLQRKGYRFLNRRCTKHNHPMKEWKRVDDDYEEPPKWEFSNKIELRTPFPLNKQEQKLF